MTVSDAPVGTTNTHKWWSTLKAAFFAVNVTVPISLRLDGPFMLCPKGKAALFADVFDAKQVMIVLLWHSHVFQCLN